MHQRYQPVATDVPDVPNNTAQEDEAFSDPVNGTKHLQQHHSEDVYFGGRSETIVTFDYDRERLVSEHRKIELCIWIPLFFGVAYFGGLDFRRYAQLLWFLLMLFFWYTEDLRKTRAYSMHVGLADTALLFEQDKRRTWYGSARATKRKFSLAEHDFKLKEMDGDSVACFARMDRVEIYRRSGLCRNDPELVVRGLKDTLSFHALLTRRAAELAPSNPFASDCEAGLYTVWVCS